MRSEQIWQLRVKHLLDRVMGLLLSIVLAPVIGAIALLVRLDDGGPVFFLQERIGEGERPFIVWKFRTMVVDADDLLDAHGQVSGDRVTRVGRWLRLTSFDELPQLLNILRGEMSLVGPRPVLPSHLERYEDFQKRRFLMKPGITGLAQVRGRNTLAWSQRLKADGEYVEKYSLWLDAKILVRTVKTVLLREGLVMDRNPEKVDDLPPPRNPGGQRQDGV